AACPTLLCALSFPFFFSSRRRHTRFSRDWSSDVCSSDLNIPRRQHAARQQPAAAAGSKNRVRLSTIFERFQARRALSCNYFVIRSEERRVGKECRSRGRAEH